MTEPYYDDELVTLYHGDCEAVLSDLLSKPADLGTQIVVTSPPYNMGLTPGGNGRGMYRPSASRKGGRFRAGYGEHDDAMPQDEYDDWQRRILSLLWQWIPDDGAIFYNHRVRIEHGHARLPLGMNFGLPLRQIITWDRGTGIGVNVRHYCAVAEWIMLFAKPDFRLLDHGASGMGDVWRMGMGSDRSHPAPFPTALPIRAIATTGARSVLDPFAGSGTTLYAAKQAGVRATGVELNERYCETAAKRLSQGVLISQEAEWVGTP
jgi:site-specific DNA-methyltransferase (adenine-specific)